MCISLARDAKTLYKVLADQMPSHRKRPMQLGQVVFIVGTQICYDGLEAANVIRSTHGIKGRVTGSPQQRHKTVQLNTSSIYGLKKDDIGWKGIPASSRPALEPRGQRWETEMPFREQNEDAHSRQHCAQDSSQEGD